MEDSSLRFAFHQALDPIAPPAPGLADSVRRELRRRYGTPPRRPRNQLWGQPAWLVPAVAALLAVAIIAALVLAGHQFRPHSIPIKQPPPVGPVGLNCAPWAPLDALKYGPVPQKMTSPLDGWATGGLRTTDGARTFQDVTPPAFRAGVKSSIGTTLYPPGYADFFVDADHAWIARPYFSSTSCFDHVTVFFTTDGGKTWRTSAPIPLSIAGDTQLAMQLSFADAEHGWLFVTGSGRLYPDVALFATSDGGRTWHRVGQPPTGLQACAPLFSSTTSGWMGACGSSNGGGATMSLIVTRDGGATWSVEYIPAPPGGCTCSAPIDLQFLDSSTGAFITNAYNGWYLYLTTDGGATWRPLRQLPASGVEGFDLEDATHLWALAPDPTAFIKAAQMWLYESSDMGAHWTVVGKNVSVGRGGGATMRFADPMHGFIVQPDPSGKGSQVLVTIDGGRTWTVIKPEVS